MPSALALMGLGMGPQLAQLIGGDPNALTCVGTTQVGAPTIKSKNTELVTAGGATACIFPPITNINEQYFIVNPTATAALIYVPVGHTIGGVLNGNANGGTGLVQNKSIIIWQYKPKFWAFNLSA